MYLHKSQVHDAQRIIKLFGNFTKEHFIVTCLLYTSDAADERSSVDLGGRRIIKKKNSGHMSGQQSNTYYMSHHTEQ